MTKEIKSIKQLKDLVLENQLFKVGKAHITLNYGQGHYLHSIRQFDKDTLFFTDITLQFWLDNGIVEVEYEDEKSDRVELPKTFNQPLAIQDVGDAEAQIFAIQVRFNQLIDKKVAELEKRLDEKEGSNG